MRFIVVLLVLGVTLCAASERKKRDALSKLAKREEGAGEVDLCSQRQNGKTPPWMAVCGDGTCIFTDWVCDGEADCDDDETRPECEDIQADLCTEIDDNGVVPYWMRVCEDQGFCIFEDWVCDGEPDCLDSSDEKECTGEAPINLCEYQGTPGSEEWLKTCESGDECILTDWMCDKEEDCKDGSDEQEGVCKDAWAKLEGPYSGRK